MLRKGGYAVFELGNSRSISRTDASAMTSAMTPTITPRVEMSEMTEMKACFRLATR